MPRITGLVVVANNSLCVTDRDNLRIRSFKQLFKSILARYIRLQLKRNITLSYVSCTINRITPEILAMQRPSTRLINEFQLIEQFQQQGIKAIFNLQLPGEHENCGDGLDGNTGFSYNPETWMNNGSGFSSIELLNDSP
jgi:hypothetical protein